MILAIIFFTRAPKKWNCVQAIMGVELFKQGCSQKMFASLNHLGITQSVDTARGHVDQMARYHDAHVLKWKTESEVCIIHNVQLFVVGNCFTLFLDMFWFGQRFLKCNETITFKVKMA